MIENHWLKKAEQENRLLKDSDTAAKIEIARHFGLSWKELARLERKDPSNQKAEEVGPHNFFIG